MGADSSTRRIAGHVITHLPNAAGARALGWARQGLSGQPCPRGADAGGVGVGGQRSEQAIAAERGRAGGEGGEAGGRGQSRLVKGLAPAVSRADLALAQV